uniref:Sensory neuron membrane protein 2 n=1 Tax=Rhodnius prolixus TaxID=13249 RepID=T1HF98_RHOPR
MGAVSPRNIVKLAAVMRKCVNWLIFSALGFILAVGAFIFNLWILPMIVDYQVGKTMGLRNGTFVWDMFVETPVPIYLKVYFFNVENPEGIARGEIPRVKEVGPYVYRELRKKHDVTINEENDTVFYHQGTVFSFDAEKSYPLKATDKVVLVNFILHVSEYIPALVSYPHLLHTSPLYQSLVDGLKPNKTLHETFFDIEPTTGVPLKGYKRFQLNVLAKPSSAIRVLKDTKLALFPILWMEEGAEIGEDQVNILRDQLLKVLHIAEIIKWVLISCGISMAIIGAIIAIWLVRRRVHQHPD